MKNNYSPERLSQERRGSPPAKDGPLSMFSYLTNIKFLKTKNIMKASIFTSSKKALKKIFAFLSVGLMLSSTVAGAQARILFQDDTFHDIDSEAILIDSNGTGTQDTAIQFGNDAVPTNNGTITWDVINDEFDILNDVNFDGDVDMSNADAVHIKESTDPTLLVGCAVLGEVILDTTDTEVQICTATGANAVQSAGSVIVTGGTGGDTYDVIIGGVGAGGAVAFNTSLAQTAIDIATDITSNIAGYSAAAVGTTVNITADVGGTAGDATVATTLTGTAATTDNATTGGVDGTATWTGTNAGTLDGLDSTQFLRSDTSDSYTSGTLTLDNGTTLDVNGEFDGSGSTEFHIREDSDPATNSACTTVGELILDTTDSEVQVCTATGGAGAATWVNVASGSLQDFESVYSNDGDDTLTASSTFDIAATGALGLDSAAATTIGGAGVGITSDGGALAITGDGATDIDITNTGASIDIGSATLTVDTTAGFSVDGAAASNVSTSSGDLTLAGGGELVFDDGTITGTITLGDSDLDWDGDFAGNGIVDNVNDLATLLGADTISTFNFSEANVLADDDAVYAALQKLDLKWGDLASTNNGEGASLVGVEDAGGNFTATDVEGVLTEIAGQIGSNAANVETMTFEPEYENVVVFEDGSNNRGRLDADYDNTNREQFYRWTSRQNSSNDIDLRFRIELPADFVAGGDMDIRIFSDTLTLGDNSILVTVRDDTADVTCHTDVAQAASAATTWETLTITAAEINSCTLTPGDIVEVQLKMAADNSSSGAMQVGTIDYAYTN
jgi:hypothetical protein